MSRKVSDFVVAVNGTPFLNRIEIVMPFVEE